MARALVIVSFSYAPRLNPRAFRWTALAERFAALGHPVEVVTSWLPDSADNEVRNGVRVRRVGSKLLEGARSGVGGARTAAPGLPAAAVARPSPVKALGRRLWHALCWPDVTANWYFAARDAAAPLLAARAGAALISVSPTFTAVAVGHALKRRDPDLAWLIDLGDPFSFQLDNPPNNLSLYAGLNARFERAAFQAARAVAVTNQRTASRYGAEFPESAAKIGVIPPLLTLDFPVPAPATPRGGPLRMVFLGTLYRGLREPDFLLELFAAAQEGAQRPLELHFYGETGACAEAFERYRERCRGRLFVHGVVSRERALAATREADMLVNLGNQTSFQLPSKVVEYAAAGKPVVNIAPHREDSSIEFFQAYPLALNIVSEGRAPDAAQVARLREFLARPSAPDAAALATFLLPFRLEHVAARYLELIGAEGDR